MSIFIKKKKGNLIEQGFKGTEPNRFTEAIERKKRTIAGWLAKKTENYSTRQKRTGLIICCMVFAFLFTIILGSSLTGHHFGNRSIVLTHIRSGAHNLVTVPMADSVFQKAETLWLWLDSLRRYDTVKLKAILLARPYLLENLQVLENMYHSQRK